MDVCLLRLLYDTRGNSFRPFIITSAMRSSQKPARDLAVFSPLPTLVRQMLDLLHSGWRGIEWPATCSRRRACLLHRNDSNTWQLEKVHHMNTVSVWDCDSASIHHRVAALIRPTAQQHASICHSIREPIARGWRSMELNAPLAAHPCPANSARKGHKDVREEIWEFVEFGCGRGIRGLRHSASPDRLRSTRVVQPAEHV